MRVGGGGGGGWFGAKNLPGSQGGASLERFGNHWILYTKRVTFDLTISNTMGSNPVWLSSNFGYMKVVFPIK